MVGIPTISTEADGTPIVVKRGEGHEAQRRRREAKILSLASHPGVVELRRVIDRSEEVCLELAFVAGTSLEDHPPLDVGRLMKVLTATFRTVSDLHELGVHHGDLCAEHMLIDRRDRVVLCGFGNAGEISSDGSPSLAADVAGLGRLILHELARSAASGAIDEDDWAAIALAELGEDALRVAQTPGQASLAPFVTRMTDLGGGRAGQSDRPSGKPTIRWEWIGAGLAAVAVLTLITTQWIRSPQANALSDQPPDPTFIAVATDPTAVGAPPTPVGVPEQPPVEEPSPTPTLLLSVDAPRCLPPTGLDIDGDGCPDEITIDGTIISTNDGRWSLGETGDFVLVGDWDCDGIAAPGLVRQSSGSVYFFEGWSPPSVPLLAHPVATVGEPMDVEPLEGCGGIRVSTPTGPVIVTVAGVVS